MFQEKTKDILQKAVFKLRKWFIISTDVQKIFEERENYGNEAEIGDDVSYLEFHEY